MISLQTNLSGFIVQNNMVSSTNKLNQAIERLSTGYKINHASDNAANYSISKNMSVQLSACDVAADNISTGMDMVNTAQDTISGMQERAGRIHALITQARNGTYGEDSLNAMTQEAQALAGEINRLYSNTEYNGIKLLEIPLPDWAERQCAAASDGFMNELSGEFAIETPDIIVTNPDELNDAILNNTKIGIGNAETFAELANVLVGRGRTIILTEDIDVSAVCAKNIDENGIGGWNPINGRNFRGRFNGNGHTISGLYINRPDADYQGLFGNIQQMDVEIINVGLENVNITGKDNVGAFAGAMARRNTSKVLINNYATGKVTGQNDVGGLVGYLDYGWIYDCDVSVDVAGQDEVGGVVGRLEFGSINYTNTAGNVTGQNDVGGVVGYTNDFMTSCYVTGNVIGQNNVGGVIGTVSKGEFDSMYSSGKVTGNDKVGSLIGRIINTTDGTSFSTITFTNASARQGDAMIGFEGASDGTAYESGQMESWLENITAMKLDTTLQVGTYGDSDSQIAVDTKMNINFSVSDLTSDRAYNSITAFLNKLSEKSTQLGAAQNRLESALESNLVKMDNLTSSLSTIKDADISEVSSDFIRQQILQQAAATLMSTANQSPAIALQLI